MPAASLGHAFRGAARNLAPIDRGPHTDPVDDSDVATDLQRCELHDLTTPTRAGEGDH